MSSMFTNLLFMHGHITNLELAQRLADTPAPANKPTGKRGRTPGAADAARKSMASAALASSGGAVSADRLRTAGVIVTALRWATAR